ncbi:kinesin-like protein isoform X2, partial [Aphis craccivora]
HRGCRCARVRCRVRKHDVRVSRARRSKTSRRRTTPPRPPSDQLRRVLICSHRAPTTLESRVCLFLFSGPQQQQRPPSSSPAVVPCHRRRRADEEEGEDRHRHRTSAVVVPSPPNGGGRNGSSAANPEQSARSRTHRTDETHALYAAAKAAEDEVRRLTRGRLPLPTTTIDSESATAAALDYRRRRYGMYATATVTADDRYGHRYGLSSGLMTQDPKTSSAAAAFFLRPLSLVAGFHNIVMCNRPTKDTSHA